MCDMDIGAADAGGVYFDDYVARGWFGVWDVVKSKVCAAVPGLCLHIGCPEVLGLFVGLNCEFDAKAFGRCGDGVWEFG